MKILFFTFLFVFYQAHFLYAQKPEDIDLLKNTDFVLTADHARKVTYGFSENPSKFSLFNPVYHLLSGSMYVYQKFVSPQLAKQCLFVPSCSAYSKQLIRDYGIAKGIFCSADRLMRCNRIAYAGLPRSAFDEHDHKVHENTDKYSFRDK